MVLVGTEFESTIGLIARAMKNFNLRDLRLVEPVVGIGKEARLRASHAQEVLDKAQTLRTLDEALGDTDVSVGTTAQRSRSVYKILREPVTPRKLAENLRALEGTVALVFGPEGTGLNNDELDKCDVILTIPASPVYPTLNISHAAVVLFHELYVSRSNTPGEILAGGQVRRRILAFVEKTSEAVGIQGEDNILVVRAFKSMMGRSGLRAREASLLAGFLRKISTNLVKAHEDDQNEVLQGERGENKEWPLRDSRC